MSTVVACVRVQRTNLELLKRPVEWARKKLKSAQAVNKKQNTFFRVFACDEQKVYEWESLSDDLQVKNTGPVKGGKNKDEWRGEPHEWSGHEWGVELHESIFSECSRAYIFHV